MPLPTLPVAVLDPLAAAAFAYVDAPSRPPLAVYLAASEAAAISAVLLAVGGDRGRAAELLGLPLRTLYHRLATLRAGGHELPAAPEQVRGERGVFTANRGA